MAVWESDLLAMVKRERQKYKQRKRSLTSGRERREDATLAMLAKFQTRLHTAHTLAGQCDDDEGHKEEEERAEGGTTTRMICPEDAQYEQLKMRHKLHFEAGAVGGRVLDPNVHDDDRYSIHDPRNPLTQRRRQARPATRDAR
ncbi:hypothetical protein ACOMHN_056632 [Nucella lapillus]